MIKKAQIPDLEILHSITKKCASHMIKKGIFQWNSTYPSREILKNDINLKQIWKLVESTTIVGIIVLTNIEDKEYKDVKWVDKNSKNLYVHRLAVLPEFQGKGYAKKLMNFAEDYAKEHNYNSIRLDTFSQNKQNQKFYEKRDYKKVGSIYLSNQSKYPFYCYEKIINV